MKQLGRILLVVLLLAVAAAVPAAAGVLTAGNYTYILKGHELALSVDILTVQGGYLVPEDLVKALDVKVEIKVDTVHLRRGPVDVALTLGRDTAVVGGQKQPVKAAPMRVSDRLFVPADILPLLGLSMVVDGKFVLLHDYGPGTDVPGEARQDFASISSAHTVTGSMRATNGVPVRAAVTLLTEDLLKDKSLDMPWGVRLELLAMLGDRTLFLVSVQNDSFRSVTLDPSKLLVTDDAGRQYYYQKQEIPVVGVITDAIAPGAKRSSVLVFEKASGPVSLFDDAGNQSLGKVTAP